VNFATFVEPIAVRDDDESVPDFKSRAKAILAERGGGCIVWGAPEEVEWVDAEVETIVVTGGISEDASGDIAQFSVQIERQDGESVEAFRARARETAIAAGSDRIVFGGLKPMPMGD
jgi:hypothetical protein